VIDQFLYDEFRKDHAVVEALRGCVSQIHAQKTNKIRWSFEENVEAAMVEQQQQQFVQGESSSSAQRVPGQIKPVQPVGFEAFRVNPVCDLY
jgi:hypothetical protein